MLRYVFKVILVVVDDDETVLPSNLIYLFIEQLFKVFVVGDDENYAQQGFFYNFSLL